MWSSVHLVILKLFRVFPVAPNYFPELVPVLMWNCWFRDSKNLRLPRGREGSTSGLQLCALGEGTCQCSHWCQWHNLHVLDTFPDPTQFLCCADASLKEAYGLLSTSWEIPSKAQHSHLRSGSSRSLGVSWSLKSLHPLNALHPLPSAFAACLVQSC